MIEVAWLAGALVVALLLVRRGRRKGRRNELTDALREVLEERGYQGPRWRPRPHKGRWWL